MRRYRLVRAPGEGCGRGCLIFIGVVGGLLVLLMAASFIVPRFLPAGGGGGDQPARFEIGEAVSKQIISLTIKGGGGIEYLEASATLGRLVRPPVTIFIQPGTLFEPASPHTQSMVATWLTEVILSEKGEEREFDIRVACANMHLGTPGSFEVFSISTQPMAGDLQKLVSLPDFKSAGFRVRQFAVWTITDDPGRDHYMGIGSFGSGSGPNPANFETIRALFVKAGIDPSKYQAFR